jgi:hypothetical protein
LRQLGWVGGDPRQLDFVVNVKTAQQLGINVARFSLGCT